MLLASLPSRGRPPLSSGLLFSGTHQFAEEMNVEFVGSQAEWANGSAIVACDSAAYDLRRIVRPGRPLSRSQSHKRVRSDVVFWINRIAEYLVGDGRHEGRPCPLVAPPCRAEIAHRLVCHDQQRKNQIQRVAVALNVERHFQTLAYFFRNRPLIEGTCLIKFCAKVFAKGDLELLLRHGLALDIS